MKRVLQVFNFLALLMTVFVNYYSNSGRINSQTIGEVSAKYANRFTPAGYAFSIWGLIYLGLFAFVIYQGRSLFVKKTNDTLVTDIGSSFIVSCVANSLWVIAWLYEYMGLSVFMMLLLLFSLTAILFKLKSRKASTSWKERFFVRFPFVIYAGWITVALIANVAAFLTKIQWDGFGLSDVTWTIIIICVAGLINILVTWMVHVSEFGLVGAWALIAVAMANWDNTLIKQVAISVAVLLIISSVARLLRKAKPGYQTRGSF